jgi:hypothetical protein
MRPISNSTVLKWLLLSICCNSSCLLKVLFFLFKQAHGIAFSGGTWLESSPQFCSSERTSLLYKVRRPSVIVHPECVGLFTHGRPFWVPWISNTADMECLGIKHPFSITSTCCKASCTTSPNRIAPEFRFRQNKHRNASPLHLGILISKNDCSYLVQLTVCVKYLEPLIPSAFINLETYLQSQHL